MSKNRSNFGCYAGKVLLAGVAPMVALTAGISTSALAEQQGSLMEEITVTAQKREESAQDVGIAMAVFSASQIEALGIDTSTDIAKFTPGVHIGGSIAGQNSLFTIRGVTQNDFGDLTESPVAVYIDDSYVAMAQGQNFAMYDLDRVEVLKGPQGTLFGRNATGGLISYITRKPTRETEGFMSLELGDYSKVTAEGAYGGPINDKSSFRISGMYTGHDELLKNQYAPDGPGTFPGNAFPLIVSEGGGANLWNNSVTALRGQYQFDFSDDTNLLLSTNWSDSDVSTGPYQSEPTAAVFNVDNPSQQVNTIHLPSDATSQAYLSDGTGIPLTGPTATRPLAGGDWFGWLDPDGRGLDQSSSDFAFHRLNELKTWAGDAKFSTKIGDNDFISISDYKQYDKFMAMDVDAAPVNQLSVWWDTQVWQFTQELRLQGATDKMKWVAGLYYMHVDTDSISGFKELPGAGATLPPFLQEGYDYPAITNLKTDSYSIFGQVDYSLTDRLTLIAGWRLIEEHKDYNYSMQAFATNNARTYAVGVGVPAGDITGLPAQYDFSDSTGDRLWAGKLQLNLQVTEDALLYAGVNRGAKAGGFNAPIDFGFAQLTPGFKFEYQPEELTSYEAGFKTEWFGNTRVNGALFYYQYNNYQGFLFSGAAGNVVNNDATNTGGELEIITSPIENLEIMLGASIFDATVKNVQVDSGLFKDVKPAYAPENQYSALVRYGIPVPGGKLTLQGDVEYTDSFYFTLRNFDAHKLDSYTVGNVRLTYAATNDHYELSAYVNNVSDETYGTIGYDLSTFCGCSEIMVGNPRWWGAEAKYKF